MATVGSRLFCTQIPAKMSAMEILQTTFQQFLRHRRKDTCFQANKPLKTCEEDPSILFVTDTSPKKAKVYEDWKVARLNPIFKKDDE